MKSALERLETPREIDRFWKKVVVDDVSDCWVWVGARGGGRGRLKYGRVGLRGKVLQASRVAYTTWRGDIPDGIELDHLVCDFPPCVNPWHLKLATARENVLRSRSASAMNARKLTCINGHPLDASGSVYSWYRDGRVVQRRCRQCSAERDRRRPRGRTPEGRAKAAIRQRRYRARKLAAAAT